MFSVHSLDYKKRNIRKIYIRKIQEGLLTSIPSITIEDIEDKLHKLRMQYQDERNKIRSSSKNGVGLNGVHKSRFWFYEKTTSLDRNEMMKSTVSTLNVENILEENVQSEISLSVVNDVNTCVFENLKEI